MEESQNSETETNINFNRISAIDCCFNIRRSSRIITQIYDFAFRKIGITSSQFFLLAALANNDMDTLTSMADDLGMDRSTLSRNLPPLKHRHYIENSFVKDKRKIAYQLTESGHSILRNAYIIWKPLNDKIIAIITLERYGNFLDELTHLTNILPDQFDTF